MKRVLAVSDDAEFLDFLREAFCSLPGFQVVPAQNGWEAMAELRLRPASLAILDFSARNWDSYQLLGEIHEAHPDLAVLGLTQTAAVAVERRKQPAGPVRMLQRQVAPERLIEEAMAMLHGAAKGHIEGIQLSSLLQVLDWERKDCLCRVTCRGSAGQLHFHRGYLIHAERDKTAGTEAALEILAWEEARIEFLPSRETARSIELPLKELLMMAAQRRDEGERAG